MVPIDNLVTLQLVLRLHLLDGILLLRLRILLLLLRIWLLLLRILIWLLRILLLMLRILLLHGLLGVHHIWLGKLILNLARHCSHHRILVVYLLQNLCLLNGYDVQRIAVSRVFHLIQYDIHISLAQPISINEVLDLKHIKSNLLGLLKEFLSLHLEKLRNLAGHVWFAHWQLLLILLSLHFCFWKWWDTTFAHIIEQLGR